jgi:predicted DNA-binding protein (MmcQ/YjbR family)
MNIEMYRNHCISKKAATESFPFPGLPDVLVFKVAGKMFTAADVNSFTGISVRCDADKIDELRAVYPALQKHTYFSERHWTMVMMDNTIPDKQVLQWLDESYNLAVKTLTKKMRLELEL